MKEIGEINNDWRFKEFIPKSRARSLVHVGVNVKIYYDEPDNIYYICLNDDKYYIISTTNIDDIIDIKTLAYFVDNGILVIESRDNRKFIFDENLKPIRLKIIFNEE